MSKCECAPVQSKHIQGSLFSCSLVPPPYLCLCVSSLEVFDVLFPSQTCCLFAIDIVNVSTILCRQLVLLFLQDHDPQWCLGRRWLKSPEKALNNSLFKTLFHDFCLHGQTVQTWQIWWKRDKEGLESDPEDFCQTWGRSQDQKSYCMLI